MAQNAATVLIIDDELAIRELLEDHMFLLGHKSILAEDGCVAMTYLEEGEPDLILLDIMMPTLDGHGVLARLKDNDRLRSIPVVVISALDDMDSVARCIEAGADDYLTKPIEPRILAARVGNCLEKRRLAAEEASLKRQLVEHNRNLEKRVREQVAQIAKVQRLEAIATLAGGIAHDFNNILSAIIGYTRLARETLSPEDPMAADLDRVLAAGNRATSLVRQILAFGRRTEGEEEAVELGLIVKEALKFLKAALPANIKVKKNVGQDLGVVRADPTQLHQVVMNLCTNAYQAMKGEGGARFVSISRAWSWRRVRSRSSRT